jgi:cytochrome c oxidase subunit 2
MPGIHATSGVTALLQSGVIPTGSRVTVFQSIYGLFLGLGTLVGVVVIAYMLYNAYKYRAEAEKAPDADRPQLGELPRGGGGGRKLFMSFGLSALIVISLIAWTYGTLLYVEQDATSATGAEIPGDANKIVEVQVVGYQFGWEFHYESVPGQANGVMTRNELRVPQGYMVKLNVTSDDVWHNFGVPELRVKSDAIPGQYTESWFVAEETGEYAAHCYELCGTGHSQMDAKVYINETGEFEQWYAKQAADQNVTADANASATSPAVQEVPG